MTGIQIFVEWLASFAEVLLYLCVIDAIFERQFQKGKQIRFALILAAFIALGVVMLNMVNVSISLPTMVYALAAYALGAKILYRGRLAELLFASIGFVAFLACMDMGCVFTLNHIGMASMVDKIARFSRERIIFLVLIKLLEIALVFLLCWLLRKKAFYKEPGKLGVMIVCLVLGSAGSIYWVMRSELLGLKLDFFQVLLGLIGVLIVSITYLLLRVREVRKEQEYTDRKNRLLEINYLSAKEAYESNARLYHDMNSHFLVVQNYLADGKVTDAQKYLSEVVGERGAYCVEPWTGIEAVDYILSQKSDAAKKKGINVHIHSEYPKDCGIDPVDLCTILTNLFDNAIEACEKCPQDGKREIVLHIRRIHQFIIIRVTNSSVSAPVIRDGRLLTSKENKQRHGWGLQNVKAAVEKYQGTIEYEFEDSVFTVSIMVFYQ